jgi:hypothetical protein
MGHELQLQATKQQYNSTMAAEAWPGLLELEQKVTLALRPITKHHNVNIRALSSTGAWHGVC